MGKNKHCEGIIVARSKFTLSVLWKMIWLSRKYSLFKKPLCKVCQNFTLDKNKPLWTRNASNAGRGRGLYAIEDPKCGLKSGSYFLRFLIVS